MLEISLFVRGAAMSDPPVVLEVLLFSPPDPIPSDDPPSPTAATALPSTLTAGGVESVDSAPHKRLRVSGCGYCGRPELQRQWSRHDAMVDGASPASPINVAGCDAAADARLRGALALPAPESMLVQRVAVIELMLSQRNLLPIHHWIRVARTLAVVVASKVGLGLASCWTRLAMLRPP